MDRSQLESFFRTHLASMMDHLCVGHWTITARAEPNSDSNLAGSCERELDYEWAVIRMNPELFETDTKALDTLFHELAHVILAPFDLYREAQTQHIAKGTPEERQDSRIFNHAVEQCVMNLERLWRSAGIRDAYLERLTKPDGQRE